MIHPQAAHRPMAMPFTSTVEVIDPQPRLKKVRLPSPVREYLQGYSLSKQNPKAKNTGWKDAKIVEMAGGQDELRHRVARKTRRSTKSPQEKLENLSKDQQEEITQLLQRKRKTERNEDAEWSLAYVHKDWREINESFAKTNTVLHRIDVIFEHKKRSTESESSKGVSKSTNAKAVADIKGRSKRDKKGKQPQSDEYVDESFSEGDEPDEENPPGVVDPPRHPIITHREPLAPLSNTQMPFRQAPPINLGVYVPDGRGLNTQYASFQNLDARNPFQPGSPPLPTVNYLQMNGMAEPLQATSNDLKAETIPPPIARIPVPPQNSQTAYNTAAPALTPQTERPKPGPISPRQEQQSARRRVDEWKDRSSSYYTNSEASLWSSPNSPRRTTPATSPSRGRGGYYHYRDGNRVYVHAGRSDTRGGRDSSVERRHEKDRQDRADRDRRDEQERRERRERRERQEREALREREREAAQRALDLDAEQRHRARDDASLERHRQRSRDRGMGAGYNHAAGPAVPRTYADISDTGRSNASNAGSGSRDAYLFDDEERRMHERETEERIRAAYRKGHQRGASLGNRG